jgi:hypothetical protein
MTLTALSGFEQFLRIDRLRANSGRGAHIIGPAEERFDAASSGPIGADMGCGATVSASATGRRLSLWLRSPSCCRRPTASKRTPTSDAFRGYRSSLGGHSHATWMADEGISDLDNGDIHEPRNGLKASEFAKEFLFANPRLSSKSNRGCTRSSRARSLPSPDLGLSRKRARSD